MSGAMHGFEPAGRMAAELRRFAGNGGTMPTMLRNYANTSLGQVHFREMGQGAPLLLLHQTAESGAMFSEVMPLFAKNFRVIAMDTPGFGDSDKPAAAPGIEGYAKAVAEFLDSLGINKANVLGHHTGASIAVEFASTWPDRVIKLVLS